MLMHSKCREQEREQSMEVLTRIPLLLLQRSLQSKVTTWQQQQQQQS